MKAAHEALRHIGLGQRDDGCIHIDGNAIGTGLIESLARRKAQLGRETGLGVTLARGAVGIVERHISGGLVDVVFDAEGHREVIVPLVAVFQACGAQVLHPHVLVATQCEEDVVLIGVEVVLGQLVHVIAVGELQAMDGKLLVERFLGREGILERAHILEFLVTESIGRIGTGKPVTTEVHGRHPSQTQPEAFE